MSWVRGVFVARGHLGDIQSWLTVWILGAGFVRAQTTRNPNGAVELNLSGAGVVYIMDWRPPARSPKPNLNISGIYMCHVTTDTSTYSTVTGTEYKFTEGPRIITIPKSTERGP